MKITINGRSYSYNPCCLFVRYQPVRILAQIRIVVDKLSMSRWYECVSNLELYRKKQLLHGKPYRHQ